MDKYASRVIHYSLGRVFNFHSLRHTHATLLIENGANILCILIILWAVFGLEIFLLSIVGYETNICLSF